MVSVFEGKAWIDVWYTYMTEAMTLWTAANSGSRQKRAPLLSVTLLKWTEDTSR